MALWIFEESVFGEDAETMSNAIVSRGGRVKRLSIEQELAGRYGHWSQDESVLFRGSFEAARAFRQAHPQASPGVIGTDHELECSNYYPLFGENLLNAGARFVEHGTLVAEWPSFQREFGSASLFVRPNSGSKSFSGQVVDDLESFLRREANYLRDLSPSDKLVVSAPKPITDEYRLLVVQSQVITGCKYRRLGARTISPDLPVGLSDWASRAIDGRSLPDAFALDVAVLESGVPAVVEINSFSSADFYACNRLAVVAAVEDWLVPAPNLT